jgi:proteic killer suppression protein
VVARARRMLDRLAVAGALADMKVPPSNRLEQLKGDLAGFHSVRVNDQWRITFRWTDAGPAEVRFTDYH